MSHLEERMEADLNYIRDWLWQIGEDVEAALRTAKKTLILRDPDLAYGVILGDHPINRNSRQCDRMCHTFIARYLPGAGALREMASTTRINVILERIGDYAVTMCREAVQLEKPLPRKFSSHIDSVADNAIEILSSARSAFREGNAERAIALMGAAKRMDALMDGFYSELFDEGEQLEKSTMMVIFVVFNLLKRVADQAKNICDQTVYAVRGIAKLPKVYRILFVAEQGSELGQLAVAIGRKNFPDTAQFAMTAPGGTAPVSEDLASFLAERGLEDGKLRGDPLAVLEHDLADFAVIVALNGKVSDYFPKIPFHTSALNWAIPEAGGRDQQYRLLSSQITDLVNLLAGEESTQA